MSILKQGDKRKLTYYHNPRGDFSHKISIITDDGGLLRFDRYRKPEVVPDDGEPVNAPVLVQFRAFADDQPFMETVLDIDADPRYATINLWYTAIPLTFRTRKIHLSCVGQHKITGNTEVLFHGEIHVLPE